MKRWNCRFPVYIPKSPRLHCTFTTSPIYTIYMCVCVYKCMYVYAKCVFTCMCLCVYVCVRARVCVHMYVYVCKMCVLTWVCVYKCMYMYVYAKCVYLRVCVCVCSREKSQRQIAITQVITEIVPPMYWSWAHDISHARVCLRFERDIRPVNALNEWHQH